MDIIQAVILGVVEGVTEFLPISSTFHLIFASKLLGIAQNDFVKLFEVFIQGGAILAVALLFSSDVVKSKDLFMKVIVAFIPTAIVGLILHTFIKNVLFENEILMIGIFALMGVVFIGVEWLVSKKKVQLERDIKQMSYREALLIGVIQSLAVVPGVSRAGVVIIGMMLMKYKRDVAAYYSFLLAVPTILAASFYDLFKMRSVVGSYSNEIVLLAAGFVTAFISAFLVLRWLIEYLKRRSLSIFGFYRLVLAIILSILFLR